MFMSVEVVCKMPWRSDFKRIELNIKYKKHNAATLHVQHLYVHNSMLAPFKPVQDLFDHRVGPQGNHFLCMCFPP